MTLHKIKSFWFELDEKKLSPGQLKDIDEKLVPAMSREVLLRHIGYSMDKPEMEETLKSIQRELQQHVGIFVQNARRLSGDTIAICAYASTNKAGKCLARVTLSGVVLQV